MLEYESDALLIKTVTDINPVDDFDHIEAVDQLYSDIANLADENRKAKNSLITDEEKLRALERGYQDSLDSKATKHDQNIAAFRSMIGKQNFSQERFSVYRNIEESTKTAIAECEALDVKIDDNIIKLQCLSEEVSTTEREIYFTDRLLSMDKESLTTEIAEAKNSQMLGYDTETLRKKRNNYTIMGLVAGVILMVITFPLTQWSLANIQEDGGIVEALLIIAFFGGITVWLLAIESDWFWIPALCFVIVLVIYFLPLLILVGGGAGGWALVTAQIRQDEASAQSQSGATKDTLSAIGSRVIVDCEDGFDVMESELVSALDELLIKFYTLQEKVAERKDHRMAQLAKLESFRAKALGA